MSLKIYNTLTRKKESFVPLRQGEVGMYVCGPTVYDHAHIGHAKTYVSFDTVVRYLRISGYHVRYIQNITDVGHLTDDADAGEDKITRRAALHHVAPMALVETYMRSYFDDMDALNVMRPDISPRASGHIPEQIELVRTLIEKGHAYEANGSVYFSVASFPEYGKLSGRRPEAQKEGARVGVNPEKRDPADFALWKRAEPGHILRWPSPWGVGFPGWHAECSAMAMKYIGDTVDIHGGGLDNVFPHHECEIAQSEAATGRPFVRNWMHNNMVTVDGVRMGKSLGNFVTIKDALTRFPAMAVRFFVLTSHYRSPLDFSEEAVSAAERGLERLYAAIREVRARIAEAASGETDGAFMDQLEIARAAFLEAMDDDFNTADAVGVLFDFTRAVNTLLHSEQTIHRQTWVAIDALYAELGGEILGIVPKTFEEPERSDLEEPLMALLVDTRRALREAKQWALSDAIRDRLSGIGVSLEDGPEGTVWGRKKS
ncbi:MAG: cysteine--tRNA ligase [Candidatus Latescibacterota bacterium]